MTSDDMKVSKGLGCPGVTLAGVGYLPAKGEDERKSAWFLPRLADQFRLS